MYLYKAFGIVIESELEIPEFQEGNGKPNVRISLGEVPEELDKPTTTGVVYQAKENAFLLRLDNIGAYLVENGSTIIIEPSPNSTEQDVRLFLLGSAFGALLHQRGLLVIHGSAIETDSGIVIFSGDSGIGKSTLAAAFNQRGYRIVADDICAISLDESGKPIVESSFPQLKLWGQATKKLKLKTKSLTRVRQPLDKFAVPVRINFSEGSQPLQAIFGIFIHNEPDFKFEKIDKAPIKFKIVLGNTYRQRFLDGLEMRKKHFDLTTSIIANTDIYSITRPQVPFLLDELLELIEGEITK